MNWNGIPRINSVRVFWTRRRTTSRQRLVESTSTKASKVSTIRKGSSEFLSKHSMLFCARVSVPETWTRYTEENIRRALSEISQSDELLNSSNQLMSTSNNDMWSQWNHVNVSLENRVQEEQVAKNKIQAHLEKVSRSLLCRSKHLSRGVCYSSSLGSARNLRCRTEYRVSQENDFRQGIVLTSGSNTVGNTNPTTQCRGLPRSSYAQVGPQFPSFKRTRERDCDLSHLDSFKKCTTYMLVSLICTVNSVKRRTLFNIYYAPNRP